jgi:hypothetical protein
MKNIHVLPTDKPSNGYILGKCIKELSDVKIGQFTKTYYLMFSEEYFQSQNIYITNNETIKEGWYFNKAVGVNKPVYVKNEDVIGLKRVYGENLNHLQKIVLTTDRELIKDGVQAIDDDFLEWFIENQSCEFVEVKHIIKEYVDEQDAYGYDVDYYKIIIPKEEPKGFIPDGNWNHEEEVHVSDYNKQKTLEEFAINWWQNKQIIQQQGLCNIYLPNSFYLSLKKNEIIFIFNEEHKL